MEKIAKQLTLKYAFLQSSYWISECIIYSFAAVFLHYKNFDNTNIGLILSSSAVISIFLQPLVSAFADKSRKITLRYLVIALMLLVFVFALVLYIIPDSFLLIASIYVLINAIQFTLNPLLNSLAFKYLNKGIPMNFGLARGTGSIAFAVISYLLGVSVDRFGAGILLSAFLISYCFLIIAAFTFTIKNKPEASDDYVGNATAENRKNAAADKDEPFVNTPTSIFGFFLKYKKFVFLLSGIAMLFYSHSLVNTYLINIIEAVGGNSSNLGLSLTISASLELPTMAAFIFIIKKVKCSTLLKISAFFFFTKSGVLWLAPSVSFVYLSQFFQMFAFALFTPASIYYVNSIIEEQDRIKGQSMLGVATLGIAGTVAYITGGKILDTYGVSAMLLLGTIVAAIGFIVICFSTEEAV